MKNSKIKNFIIILIAVSVFFIGIYFGRNNFAPAYNGAQVVINPEKGRPREVDFSLFWDAWRELEDNFVDKSKLDMQKMLYGAISGMAGSLEDPYTVFMDPEETDRFSKDISGSFEGIGAELGMKNNAPAVIAPLPGTPADKAGIRPGDKIIKVNDVETAGLSLDRTVEMIRGPKGTEVVLTIIREGAPAPLAIKIIRGKIEVPSLKSEINDNVAIIHLYQFTKNADKEFKKAANEAIKNGAEKLILDLRNNPGGYLDTAIQIASQFIEEGKIVAIEEGKGGKKEHKSSGGSFLKNIPAAVIINEGSASASEIVAGALRDQNGIKLIGKKTFGKGSVQELRDLKKGSSLKVTVAKWLTPSGVCINHEGINPDIEVNYTEDDFKSGRDPQMEKTMEILMKEKSPEK